MIIKFERNDITKMYVDCIVNAANNTLLGGGGVDGAIHRAAGPMLLKECMTLGGCETGKAKITKGYNLPAKYIIHTVGPIYQDGEQGEEKMLRNCYYNSLILAKEHNIKTIAFPLISAGIFGYPKREALTIALRTIKQFGKNNPECEMVVTMIIFSDTTANIACELFGKLDEYIETNLLLAPSFDDKLSLEIRQQDKSFSETLLGIIDKKKLKDVDVYNNANIDRKLFSKIRSGSHPKRTTAIALCIALKLSYSETTSLLKKTGYALSESRRFDIIIKYFIRHRKYDINEINAALFAYDEVQLGVV